MTSHTFEKHDNCTDPYCRICSGGLSICIVCGGAEGSLTTHCPMKRIPERFLDKMIYQDGWDYRDGKWLNPEKVRG